MEKRIKTITLIIMLIVTGVISVRFLGKDNPIEKSAEMIIDKELMLPDGVIEKIINELGSD